MKPIAQPALLFGLMLPFTRSSAVGLDAKPAMEDYGFEELLREPTDILIQNKQDPLLKTSRVLDNEEMENRSKQNLQRLENLATELKYEEGVATRSVRDFILKFLLDQEHSAALSSEELQRLK